jgi:hypothetical protein
MAIWNNLWPFGKMYGILVLFVVFWNISFLFWSVLVCTKKNLATLLQSPMYIPIFRIKFTEPR